MRPKSHGYIGQIIALARPHYPFNMNSIITPGKLTALAAAIAAGIFIGLFAFNLYERYQFRADVEAFSAGIREFTESVDSSLRSSAQDARERASSLTVDQRRKAQMAEQRLRTKRERSEVGQMLARRCLEWQQANLEFKSISSRQGEQKACNDFELYLATGRLPPSS